MRADRGTRGALRLVAVVALVLAVGGVTWVVLSSDDKAFFDPNMNRELSLAVAQKLAIGTSRERVEGRVGPGGRAGSRYSFIEPPGAECRYYVRLGGGGHVQLCYGGGRLRSALPATDLSQDDYGGGVLD